MMNRLDLSYRILGVVLYLKTDENYTKQDAEQELIDMLEWIGYTGDYVNELYLQHERAKAIYKVLSVVFSLRKDEYSKEHAIHDLLQFLDSENFLQGVLNN